MKAYAVYRPDGLLDGFQSSAAAAKARRAALLDSQIGFTFDESDRARFSRVEPVEVPTDKPGLLAFLNGLV